MTTTALEMASREADAKWLRLWLSERKSKDTRETYARALNKFFGYLNMPMGQMRREDILRWRASLELDGLGPRSRNLHLAAVKAFFKYVLNCEPNYLMRNVVASLEGEPYEPKQISVPTEKQAAGMLEADLRPEESLVIKFLYYVGCRASALGQVRWADFEPNDKTCHVRLHNKGGGVYSAQIPLGLYRELQEVRGEFDPPLPYARNWVYKIARKAGKLMGAENVGAHTFRHACATYLARSGMPESFVGEQLGHKSADTTKQYFHRLGDERVTKALEQAVGGKK